MRLLPEPYDALRRDAGLSQAAVALGILAVWLIPAALAGVETAVFWRMRGLDNPLWRAFAGQAPGWLSWAVLTPLILRAAQRLPLRRGALARNVALHLLLALLCGIGYAAAAAASSLWISPMAATARASELLVAWYLSGLPLMVLSYFAVIGAGSWLHWFARTRQQELAAARLGTQLAEARLAALRTQLHPHFLFNSLNALSVLVRGNDNAAAERMLELLGELLRDSLRMDTRAEVRLGEELDFVRRYLEIERVRFPDRLRIRYDAPAALEDAVVPALLLQPLVENALRHGIGRSAEAGLIQVEARAIGDTLRITVADDGPGPPSGATDAAGVGLSSVRARLAALHGAAASLELRPRAGGGAECIVELPLRLAAAGQPAPAPVLAEPAAHG